MEYEIQETLSDLRYNCCQDADTDLMAYTIPGSDRLHYEENPYNFRVARLAEDVICVGDKIYVPSFELIKYRNTPGKVVPVFWENAHTVARDRKILYDKYYDLAIHCCEFVILCKSPIHYLIGDSNDYKTADDIQSELGDIIDKIISDIKHSDVTHKHIKIMLINGDSFCDPYDGLPDPMIRHLMAKNPIEKKEPLIGDMTVNIRTGIDSSIATKDMFPINDRDKYIAFRQAFSTIRFSLNKRHHYQIPRASLFSSSYKDGVISTQVLIEQNDIYNYVPLKRFLKKHKPEEVTTTRLPIWSSEYYESNNMYSRLLEDDSTKIISMTINYNGKTFAII